MGSWCYIMHEENRIENAGTFVSNLGIQEVKKSRFTKPHESLKRETPKFPSEYGYVLYMWLFIVALFLSF